MQLTKLPFATRTITLYNRYCGKDEYGKTLTIWVRHIVESCCFGKSDKAITVGNVTIGSDDCIVQIPEDSDYLEPWEWASLPDEKLAGHFTVNVGDVVIGGEVADEIATSETPSALLQKYAGISFTANFAANNTGVGVPLGHYALGGK